MKNEFAYGVDLGWVSQLEALGYHWIDPEGKTVDPIQAAKDLGANAVRLRVFVNPPAEGFWDKLPAERCMLGYCDAKSVLAMARRVKAQGMRLMIDFHYSDHFADPNYQDIPAAWSQDSDARMEERVRIHTTQVLELLKSEGIFPDWVQVGNEINPGLLLPRGSLKTAPAQLVRFLNAGYEAVKAVCPESLVITHLAGLQNRTLCVPFLDNFFENRGKTDMLGLSFYPYWYKCFPEPGFSVKEGVSDLDVLRESLTYYLETYHLPILLSEIGGEDDDPEGIKQLLAGSIEILKSLPQPIGSGIFYWEPAANRAVLPDAYPLCAAALVGEKTLRYTDVLTAYREAQ